MITTLYFGLLCIACMVAFSNWRQAIYWAIALDFLRDPVRKLDPNESVLITVSVLGLWAVITLTAWNQGQPQLREAQKLHPKVFQAFRLMVYAMIPGSMMSLLLYSQGYKMVALGTVSYLAPAAGIVLGYLIAQDRDAIARILRFYCLVNGLALTSVVAEYVGLSWPALGGMRGMHWIRYSGMETVDLIGGFYRSPDIMGLHAAQVVMFSLTLSLQKRQGISLPWVLLACFGGLCLLLSGRRKMLGMPLIFLASLALLCHRRGIDRMQRAFVPVFGILATIGGLYLVISDDFVSAEYTNFASTLFTDGANRYREVVVGSVLGTIQQSGVIGEGIGSATQGAYHIVGRQKGGWQEDGVSRVFRELGVVGVFLVLAAGVSLFQAVVACVKRTSVASSRSVLQLCLLSVVIANLASFTVSHQQYSGDPPSALLVLIMLGMAFGLSPGLAKVRSNSVSPGSLPLDTRAPRLANPSRPVV